MTALNVIVADQLEKLHEEVTKDIEKGTEKRLAIVNVLRRYIKESKAIFGDLERCFACAFFVWIELLQIRGFLLGSFLRAFSSIAVLGQ